MQSRVVYLGHGTSREYLSRGVQNLGNLQWATSTFLNLGEILKSVEDTGGLACSEIKMMDFLPEKKR